ncbi:MAG TPA: HAMP domain-containing sensor histidine kinase [Gemmatimonadales bacterium]|nr:HAMP domain-containing sensor histidine kinase [Gemmatimonadales bacterium]
MSLPFPSGRRARAWLLAALTAVALIVIGSLAREAWRATDRHRAAAEGALRDHAGLAALAFRQQYISRIWLGSDGVFRGVDRGRHADPGSEPPSVRVLREGAERYARCGDCGAPIRPKYFFRIVVADGTLELDGDPLPPDRRVHLVRQALDLPLRREWPDWDYASFVDTLAPGLDVVFLTEWRDATGRPVAIYGYAMGLEAVAATYLRPALDGPPLLPAPGHPPGNDSLFAVGLLRPDGMVALELSSRRVPETYAARIHASRLLGGWTLRLALDPEAAPALLVGGLPHARTELLAGLLAAAALLILATIAVAWRALELADLKSEFVASVSHELRTPLAQILLFGDSLALGTMRTRRDVRVAGGIIVGEARRLLRLVDNVLMFGREDGRAPRAEAEALAPLVRDVVAGFAPVAAAAGAALAAVRVEDVAAPADVGAIRQVLLNLLDNAVKYGPRGQTVTLGLALAGERARLWVEDEGPGIPPADRARVWRPFVRLERDVDRQAAGSGIGLSVVREIVTRHRGTATIESTPGGGTRVVVELPDARPAAAEVSCAS